MENSSVNKTSLRALILIKRDSEHPFYAKDKEITIISQLIQSVNIIKSPAITLQNW